MQAENCAFRYEYFGSGALPSNMLDLGLLKLLGGVLFLAPKGGFNLVGLYPNLFLTHRLKANLYLT